MDITLHILVHDHTLKGTYAKPANLHLASFVGFVHTVLLMTTAEQNAHALGSFSPLFVGF